MKEQNSRLQSIIEQMNKSFMQFNDAALKSGLLQLNHGLAQQLKHVTETFDASTKSASEGNADGEEDANDAHGDVTPPAQNPDSAKASSRQSQYNAHPQHVDIGLGYAADLGVSTRQQASTSPAKETGRASYWLGHDSTGSGLVKFNNTVSVGRVMDQGASWNDWRTDERQDSQQLPFGLIDILNRQPYTPPGDPTSQIFSVNIPSPEITPPSTRLPTPPYLPSLSTKTLKPTWTFSHDETTFARRLTRAALETGFHLLSSANMRPAALNYVFRLSLPYMTLNELREKFKMLLGRGTDEELDCWETPFIHLGGAGTHYPRKDAQGNVIAIPNSWTVRQIGPISQKLIRAENSADPSQSHDLNIDLTGFEGEWFDAHDVEGYLEQEKGCRIDPRASFAEILIDDSEQSPTEAEEYFSGNHSLKPDAPHTRRPSDEQSDAPSFTTRSTSISTLSNATPTHSAGSASGIDPFTQNAAPFGLDMGINIPNSSLPATDFAKIPEINPSTFFDQPLGLDLAPGFDLNLNPHASTLPPINFGNDMAALGWGLLGGTGVGVDQIPVVRQSKKKSAWVDVSKLIDGEYFLRPESGGQLTPV